MKTTRVKQLGSMAFLLVMISLANGEGPDQACPSPSPSPGPTPDPPPKGPNDPAFVMADPMSEAVRKQQMAILKSRVSDVRKSEGVIAKEQERYKQFVEALKKTPDAAFDETMAIWREGVAPEVQRLVVLKALPMVRSSEQSESLQLMLRALDDVEKERVECARLARGNGLEKSLALKRIKLLDENPSLRVSMASGKN